MWRCRERVRGRNNNIIIIIRETIRTKLCNAILCISPHMSAQSWWCLCRSSRRIPCLCDWLGIRSEWVMPDGRQPKAECARTRVLTNVMHKHSCRRCWQRTSRDHRRERSKTEMKSYAIWLSIEASDLKSNVQSTHAIHLRFFATYWKQQDYSFTCRTAAAAAAPQLPHWTHTHIDRWQFSIVD